MKRSASFLVLVIFLVLPFGLRAAIEKDLGQALFFLRITDARAEQSIMTDTVGSRAALILDLRGLACEIDFVTLLHTALAKPPAPHTVRIVLVNSATDPAIVAALEDDALLSVITLSPRSPNLTADIQVATSADEERKALDALSNGTPLEKLIADAHDKRRYDEAKLVHDHANGVTPSDEELPADAEDDTITTEPTSGKKNSGAEKKAVQLPRDLVLERAVQLHRALLALKKL